MIMLLVGITNEPVSSLLMEAYVHGELAALPCNVGVLPMSTSAVFRLFLVVSLWWTQWKTWDGEALRESPVLDTDITLFERGHSLTICRLLTMLWGESFDRSSNLVLKLGGDLGRTHLDS